MNDHIAITFISYIDTMQEKIKSIYDEINKATNLPEVVDHIDEVKTTLNSLNQYTMLLIQTANQMFQEYRLTLNKLLIGRQKMESELSNKRADDSMQPHIIDTFYNEDHLISQIDFKKVISGDNDVNLSDLNIIELTDPKEYSCIGLVKRFESEKPLIPNISEIITLVFNKIFTFLDESMKSDILKIKSDLSDIQFLEELCADSPEGATRLKQIETFLNQSMISLDGMKKDIAKLNQSFIALVTNDKIYDKAIGRYTYLTVDHFLNKDKPYEIC